MKTVGLQAILASHSSRLQPSRQPKTRTRPSPDVSKRKPQTRYLDTALFKSPSCPQPIGDRCHLNRKTVQYCVHRYSSRPRRLAVMLHIDDLRPKGTSDRSAAARRSLRAPPLSISSHALPETRHGAVAFGRARHWQ
eukprot:3916504-Prymnesium_polylepis.1